MVKISLILVVVACATTGNSILTEAVDAGSSSNDTIASIDVMVGDESGSNDASGSAALTVPPVYDDSASSIGSTDADTIKSPSATSATPVADKGSDPPDSSSSKADDVSDNSSASADTDTTGPSVTAATPSIDDGSSQKASSVLSSVDHSGSVDGNSGSVNTDATSPTSTSAAPAVVDDGSAQTDSNASSSIDVGDDSTLDDTSDVNDTPTSAPTVSSPETPAPTVKGGPAPISGQVKLVPGYEDCGGFGFDYKAYMPKNVDTSAYTMLTCEKGYRCQEVQGSNTYRCKEWPSRDPVPFYGQCGGGNYDGQTFCAPGAVCKYISASFSQCLPTY